MINVHVVLITLRFVEIPEISSAPFAFEEISTRLYIPLVVLTKYYSLLEYSSLITVI